MFQVDGGGRGAPVLPNPWAFADEQGPLEQSGSNLDSRANLSPFFGA